MKPNPFEFESISAKLAAVSSVIAATQMFYDLRTSEDRVVLALKLILKG